MRDLDIEIAFLEGLDRRDPKDAEILQLLADDYTNRGRFADSLGIDLRLAKISPSDPLSFYNLACSYTLNGMPEAAFSALNRALDLGYRDFRHLSRDPDLATLRKHPLYRRIRARIRSMKITVL